MINYADNVAEAERLALDIEQSGGRAITAQADVSDMTAVARMFAAAEAAFGGVDVLVNSAGIMKLSTLADSDDGLFGSQMAVNFQGTFSSLREAARRLRDGGRIVTLSYQCGRPEAGDLRRLCRDQGSPGNADCHPGQGTAWSLYHGAAVAPGPVATDLFLTGKSPELIERIAKMNPLERLGTPADIAEVVAFLVGTEGGWINGQVLRANGGMI